MSAKPILLTVDDDPAVSRAIERDLRRRYGPAYRVLRVDSGVAALDSLRELARRDEPVALLLVDQRMPRVDGIALLVQAMDLYPTAKRVLLTAYADTDAAIQAINTIKIDHYLLKPWDPPDEHLYPVLDDLLDDWRAGYRPPFAGVRVVGHRWSADSHALRDFLGRQQVPYQWVDIEGDDGRRLTERLDLADAHLPLALLPDGTHLAHATPTEIAARIGLRTRADRPFYDLIIVGGGPAGLAAAVYGASEGLATVLLDREAPGGQAGTSSRIENYLGFPSGLSGGDLARRAVAQAQRFGVEILSPQEATRMRVDDAYHHVALSDGSEIPCHALLITTGVSYRTLDVPGVARLTGAGVYYGAAQAEALSCAGDDIYIVGGANSAGQAALYFSRHARRVTLLVRGASLSAGMSRYLIDEIEGRPNVVVRMHSRVVEACGGASLERIVIANTTNGERESVPARALFVFIGALPRTEWLGDVVARDAQGFIYSGPDIPRDDKGRIRGWTAARDPLLLETSVPGVFVAGDVRHRSVKRVASGVGEGSIAVQFIHQYLSNV